MREAKRNSCAPLQSGHDKQLLRHTEHNSCGPLQSGDHVQLLSDADQHDARHCLR